MTSPEFPVPVTITDHRPASSPLRPTFVELLRLFTTIGLQSFGGGSSTFFLIHQAVVTQNTWISEEEFARFWALCTLAPGINLVCLTILIGKRLKGVLGILACVVGLLVPSAAITVLMAALFNQLQAIPPIRAILKGVTIGAAGLSLSVAVRMAQPLLKRAFKEGRTNVAVSLIVIAVSAILLARFKLPSILALAVGTFLGALLLGQSTSTDVKDSP